MAALPRCWTWTLPNCAWMADSIHHPASQRSHCPSPPWANAFTASSISTPALRWAFRRTASAAGASPASSHGACMWCYTFNSQAAVVAVNVKTGQVQVLHVISVTDIGKVLNSGRGCRAGARRHHAGPGLCPLRAVRDAERLEPELTTSARSACPKQRIPRTSPPSSWKSRIRWGRRAQKVSPKRQPYPPHQPS